MHLHLVAGGGVQGNWFVTAHMTDIFVDFRFIIFCKSPVCSNLWEVEDKMALNRLTSCAAVLKVICQEGTIGDKVRVPMAAVVRYLGR